MTTRWIVEAHEAAAREIKRLPADLQARFQHVSELLEEFGPSGVRMPHVRPLGSKLWEMRLQGRAGIARVIYFAASGRRLVMLRTFVKKTQRTPAREIALALQRMKELTNGKT